MRRLGKYRAVAALSIVLLVAVAAQALPTSEYFWHQFAGYLKSLDFYDVYDAAQNGFIDGNDTAYGASWNGNIDAPSMNVVYDKIATLVVTEVDPCWAAWLAVPPNVSIFTNDVGYLTSYSETDPCAMPYLDQSVKIAASPTFAALTVDSPTLCVNLPSYTDQVGIGTATPTAGYKLDVAGYINSAQTVNQSTYSSVNAAQTAQTLQDGSAYTLTNATMATQYIAVKFTASAAHTMGDYTIRIKESADITNITGTLTGYICADDGGSPSKPTGSALATGGSIRFGTITTSYQILSVGTQYTMVSGTNYWLVLKYNTAPTGGNIVLDSDVSSNLGATSTDGSTWTNTDVRLRYVIKGRTYYGLYGNSTNSAGVWGTSTNSYGVYGNSTTNFGVYGYSTNSVGVYGGSANSIGFYGYSVNNYGAYGTSTSSIGVYGNSANYYGVYGNSATNRSGYFYRNNTAGTATTAVLDIVQDSATSETNTVLRVQGDGTGDLINIFDGSTEVFTILDGGNVGINTTGPTHNLTIANGAVSGGVIAINEDTDSGTNNATFTVPALAADTDYTLPPDDGDAGEQLQTDGAGTLTWQAAGLTTVDISANTNLAVGPLLTLTGDTLDANTAAVANGDTKHLATGDQIYDFVSAGYLALNGSNANTTINIQGQDFENTGHIGIGASADSTASIYLEDTTFTGAFQGNYFYLQKASGGSTVNSNIEVINYDLSISQVADTVGNVRGMNNDLYFNGGNVGSSAAAREIAGIEQVVQVGHLGADCDVWGDIFSLDLDLNVGNDANVSDDVFGIRNEVDLETGTTKIDSDVFGYYGLVDNDSGSVSGTVYLMYLDDQTGVNYCIYQNGTAPNRFGGALQVSQGAQINGAFNFAADVNAVDDYKITLTPAPTVYTTGMMITFSAVTANTGACTLNVNLLGQKSLKAFHDQDPPDNYIEAGSIVMCVYDGVNMQILSPDANPL